MPLKRIGNTVRAYHYSKADEPLRYLSGGAYGTGARGQEAGRLAGQSGLERSYFYLEGSRPQEGRLTPRPESGVGAGATYRGKLTGMYDLQENPLGLTERGNALERRLQEIGYRGYYDPQTGIAVSLRPNTEVTKVGDYRAQAEEALLRAQQLPDQPYYVTAENIPSRKTPMGAWLLEKAKDNPDLLDRYTDEVENLFEKSYLMRELDVPTYTTEQGYGAYENSIRPNIITRVPTREEAQRVADARGYLTQQDAVPFFSRVGEGPRGVNVRTENPVDALDRQRIYGNLGLDFTRSDLDALDFINYADETGPFSGMDDDQFARVINDYFSRRGDADVKLYEADTKYNPTAASWMRGGDVAGSGPGGRLGELRKRLEDYNRKFQSQHGRADPRVLALLAASTGAGALAAPAFVGTGGSSAGDIYDAALAAVTSGAQELYGAGADFVGALAGRAPPEERAPGFTPANPDNPILSGAERMLQGALSYTPPLTGRSIGEELGTIVDTFQGAGENVRNAFGERVGNVMTTGANLGVNLLDFILPGSIIGPARALPENLTDDLPKYDIKRKNMGALTKRQEAALDSPKAATERRASAEGRLSTPVEYTESPSDTWLLDHGLIQAAREGHPGVEQRAIRRQQPGPRQSMGSAIRPWQSRPNVDLVGQQVSRGRLSSGEDWYPSTYPIRGYLEETPGAVNFDDFVWANAITSPQAPVPVNLPTATAVLALQRRGLPLTSENLQMLNKELAAKYGNDNIPMFFAPQSRLDQYQAYLDTGIPPMGIDSAEKITSYGEALRGNLMNIPLDTHELAGTSYGSRLYPYWRGEGSVPTGVYGPYEDQYRRMLLDMGIMPASGQASRWIGGGELTGLRTAPGTFLDLMEQTARYKSGLLGDKSRQGALKQLRMALTGEEPLIPIYSRRQMLSVDPKDYR